jgi:hypothetical protein
LRWHTVSPELLSWRELDGELAVRNAVSGNTHLLDPLGGEVLRLLLHRNEPMTADEIARHLARDDDLDDTMAELERLGLIRRVA